MSDERRREDHQNCEYVEQDYWQKMTGLTGRDEVLSEQSNTLLVPHVPLLHLTVRLAAVVDEASEVGFPAMAHKHGQ